MLARRTLAAALALSSIGVSCATGPATFRVEHAQGAAAMPRTVAVLGVFKDGRLSPESWEMLGTQLSRPFNEPLCEAGFGDKLRTADADRYTRVEESAMHEGITDELLDGFAKDADADAIVVFHVFGRVPGRATKASAPTPPPTQMRGGRFARPPRASGGPNPFADLELEMAASIFSTSEHRTIAEISMKYAGEKLEEAVSLFAQKLAAEMPGATCRAWKL